METQDQEKLVELFNLGYRIKIYSHCVDEFVKSIDSIPDKKGQYTYSSEVYRNRSFSQVPARQVAVLKEISDWQQINE